MDERLNALAQRATSELAGATTLEAVEGLRVKYFGRKGELSTISGEMRGIAPAERKALGEALNALRGQVEEAIVSARQRLEIGALESELASARIDVTLPGRGVRIGRTHPVTQTLQDASAIFASMGFAVEHGQEIESEYFNFEALNISSDHPSRDMQDTFYVEGASGKPGQEPSMVLRTHTSPGQIRTMLGRRPPVRVIVPGRVYRRDSDQTHSPMFTQIEGLYVDRAVTFAELKGTLGAFCIAMFGAGTRTRFRPSYFPFTEPSAEVDISCVFCAGRGCRVCKDTGWIEILGSGMVHPNVFRHVAYEPSEVTGFAFGMGVERIAMLRYGIDDLRTLFENDHRFVAQF